MIQKSSLKKLIFIFLILSTYFFLFFPVAFASNVVELNVSDHNPEASTIGQAWKAWAKWVEDKGGGKINVTVHHAGTLLKGDEQFRGIKRGMADIGLYVVDRRDGFMLNTIVTLPFMTLGSQEKAALVYKDLLEKFPEMRAEFEGVKRMGMIMTPPSNIHTSKKLVKRPDDMKGMKFFTPTMSSTVAAMGATPVHLDIGDMYMSLDRGLVEGIMLPGVVTMVFGILEKLPYHTFFGEGGVNTAPMFSIMNAKKFDSLPPDIQKILEESIPVWEQKQLELDKGLQAAAMKAAKEMKHTFMNLSEEDVAAWRNLVKGPVHEKWIEENEAKGLPGSAVYEETFRLVKKYEKM